MNEPFDAVQARIVGAMQALASARTAGLGQGLDDCVAITSAETLLRRALRGLSDRFGTHDRRPATGLLMETLILEGPPAERSSPVPFRLQLPDVARDEVGRYR